MNERANTKLKTLYLWKILREDSDADHPLNAHALVDALKEYGIKAERKSIYDSLQALKDFGLEIEQAYPTYHGWYLEDKLFEAPELLLLIDAIESANFINREKSEKLVETLLDSSLSKNEKQSFQERYSYSASSNKPEKNNAYYFIETITEAIAEKKKLQIQYVRPSLDKTPPRVHVVSPYALIWSEDCYYLVCNTSRHDNFMHLRLDRMTKVNKTNENARDCREFSDKFPDGFNAEQYRHDMFYGYSGRYDLVTLECDDSLYGLVLDRFGKAAKIERNDEKKTFTLQANVIVSEGFIRWVSQFGDKIAILEPESLRQDMIRRLQYALDRYKEGNENETDTEN